ncbi:MAG: hypothetical protein K6G55_08250 [Selenomonadaceae bacterium]|nr:hypothetical protein [Selenomonadaceae bacterium]
MKILGGVLTVIIIAAVVIFSADTKPPEEVTTPEKISVAEKVAPVENVDIDLTKLNSTMLYPTVFNMTEHPAEFRGKTVKLRGMYFLSHDPAKNEDHHACVVWDATACCMQGMEFKLSTGEYPDNQTEITVVGKFDTYTVEKIDNPILIDAHLAE